MIINSPENLKGLEFYLDLYREHKVVPPDTPSVDYVAEEQYFLSGKVAMMFNGPWNLGNMYEAKINGSGMLYVICVPWAKSKGLSTSASRLPLDERPSFTSIALPKSLLMRNPCSFRGKDMRTRTIPVGLAALTSQFALDWGLLTAGGIISLVPAILVMLFLQRYLIAGLMAGAIKE